MNVFFFQQNWPKYYTHGKVLLIKYKYQVKIYLDTNFVQRNLAIFCYAELQIYINQYIQPVCPSTTSSFNLSVPLQPVQTLQSTLGLFTSIRLHNVTGHVTTTEVNQVIHHQLDSKVYCRCLVTSTRLFLTGFVKGSVYQTIVCTLFVYLRSPTVQPCHSPSLLDVDKRQNLLCKFVPM